MAPLWLLALAVLLLLLPPPPTPLAAARVPDPRVLNEKQGAAAGDTAPTTVVYDWAKTQAPGKPSLQPRSELELAPSPLPQPALQDHPPPELFPPPLPDTPRLVAATHDSLQFNITIPCKQHCPDVVYWEYQKEGDHKWQNITGNVQKGVSASCYSHLNIPGLMESTRYIVRAKPGISTQKHGSTVVQRWYNNSPDAPYSSNVISETCPSEVPPVQDLLVHTAGSRWLALSWTPPRTPCLTKLVYEVKTMPLLASWLGEFSSVGSFWSNAYWSVKGSVMPCTAWPERHCLLIVEDASGSRLDPEKEYIVEVKVKRSVDSNLESKPIIVQENTTDLAPGPPLDLQCVRMNPTELELRWRAPLRPGGRLNYVYVNVTNSMNQQVHHVARKIALSNEYTYVVNNLQANKWYHVFVDFGTTAGLRGAVKELEVWTPRSKDDALRSHDPCKPHLNDYATMAKPGSHHAARNSVGGGIPWGLWIACGVLLVLVVVALFVGRRWGSQGLWILAPQDDSKSSSGTGTSSCGDEASLCGPTITQLAATCPSSEYAEVDPSSGRAWTAPPRVLPNDYEELKSNRSSAEQAYAEVGGASESSPPYHSAVRRPGTRSPPVATAPMPVYALVDKKRPPPPPPVLGCRPGLQDSD